MRDLVLPKISVIIPTLNEEKYLPNALASLAKLNYPRQLYEIILVDNGSTDRTLAIAQNHGIDVIVDTEKTVAGLRNLGASQATGDLLAFLDADCSVTEDWLLEAAKYYHKTAIVAWGSPAQIPSNATWVQKTWYLVRQNSRAIQEVDWLESMNLFVRKMNFQEIEGFNESLVTCEDVDFCYRLSDKGKLISDNQIQIVHYGEAHSIPAFVKKEFWRGKSNLHGLLSHGLTWKETPSLLLPFYFSIALLVLLVVFMIFGFNKTSLMFFVLMFAIPTIIIVCLTLFRNKKLPGFIDLLRLVFLLQFYFWARTLTLFYKR